MLIVVLPGCDETFSPFVEQERYFTIFGYLDTASDEQMVRVMPLRTNFAARGDEPLDVEVRTTTVETGDVTVWRDSVVAFDDGSYGHVFIGDLQPIPEWTYVLEVERPDGKTSSARTTVPPATDVQILPPFVGADGAVQSIQWSDIPIQPFRVEVWYRFLTNPSRPFDQARLVYGFEDDKIGDPIGDDGWEVMVTLSADREDALKFAGLPDDAEPYLVGIGMRLTMTDDAWRPPDGIFDPNVIVQPGTFSNVDKGFGFFGSVNQYTVEWLVPEDALETMGYRQPR
jgi:hypothetical protein